MSDTPQQTPLVEQAQKDLRELDQIMGEKTFLKVPATTATKPKSEPGEADRK